MRQWEISCKDADDVPDMIVNTRSGVYWGKSSTRTNAGRLFTSDLVYGKPIGYHCIAWSEL